ncbi:hypothetical protein [Endozoicomonas sp. GU-1]|uniref:hypothetical protein n=1 Tax=Endozoicomonas sp. GU-1 TaxID=3009078 RepID=UPI0022B5A363|nr:hypothetical protein [Endozoicomonas sp. GU-1]WBA82499.1 hypothetical protein O2T12_04950 [Endozoicomonas sp. GU-1]WBA85431.1 hypothetical protein O3276_19615 [Endozoicomonas sp. GU-1]
MQSPSSSVTADTASPLTATEAGRHRPADSRKQERKRPMSGYQVEQTTTGTGTFPPHQLQSESGPIPPIKRRRVTDNSRRIVCSATSLPANPEPMETEPAMPADPASRLPGVISFLSRNLPTVSDNSLLTGNEHTSAMVQVMPEPMKDVPLTTEINSETSISEFSVSQQNELRTHLNNQEIQAILKNAGTLLKNLKDRKIQLTRDRGKPPAHSLFSKLKNFSIVKDSQTFKGYFAKANTFFLAVNPQQITNTSCLTSMLNSKTQIKKFAEESEENIQAVAANPCLKQIASMCNGKGLPDKAEVEALKAWECWKVNGEFSPELLRAFSSMCHGKGLPNKAKVEALKAWECWKVNGEFSLELLRAFSSMMSSRGLPDKAKVEALKAWECWKVNGEFSLELLRAFSSMCNGKGLPDKAKVEALKAWECWKVNGEFSLELLRAFSSICNGKGLPDKAKVEAFVAWECWKVNGEFSLELLRAFSSMMSSRGLPDKAKVEAFVAWECWKVNGEFSLELLRAFSSMMSSRGLPDKAEVEALKAWECWKVNGEFSLELLRAFSSMCHGKGLPDQAKVEALKAWECWKVNGEFSLELLRAFSSMCHGKGLPDKAKVEALKAWECWKVNGEFSLELLRVCSSMCHGKGLPDKAKVEALKAWECWKVNGEFSPELLRAFSSMMSSRGLPDKAKVEALKAWECWKVNGEFSLELLQAFSSMCHGKGLPDKAKVEAFVQWLPLDENKNILKLSCRIFASFGLPSAEKLTENEKTLRQCLNQHGCTTEHGDDNSDEDLLESSQMKALALFFSGPATWRMKIAEFQQYLAAHKCPRHDRVAVRAALKSLLPILAIHGGTGIHFWMEKYRENPRCKGVLTQALAIPAPLALTKFALTQLSESEMQEYLELCRNLKPAPTQEQWYALKPLCQQLGQRFDFMQSKRTMLEILWQQSENNRSKYADKMDELFKTLPTISQWRGLHRVFGQHKMQQFMDACLDYQATPETAPDVTIQQRLLEGMLLTNHSLPEPEKIPDLCFSKRVATDDKRGVMVGGDPAMSGQECLWHFITAMLIELEQTEYQFKNQRLTVLPDDGDPVVLQNPEFTLRDTGFVIKNWTLQQLTAFFKATEFTEQWYKKPQDKRDLYAIRLEAKLAQMQARTKEPKKAEPKKIPHLVAPSLIIRLINCHKPLKPAVWSSLEHYASSGQLNARLCTALGPVIKDDKDGIVPDLVKKAVVAKLEQIEAAKTPVVTSIPQQGLPARASIPTQGNQVANRRIQGPLSDFDAAMEALDRFRELGNAELELLEPHRSRMTSVELSTAICKMSYAVDSETRKEWHEASEKRRIDPLGLDEIVEWDLDSLATESELVNNDDWMEEFLQGL